jgi:putative DNA primase/helicase
MDERMREHMEDAYRRGFQLIPLKPDSKAPNLPVGHKFLTARASKEDYKNFHFHNGYGIVCGNLSGIVVLDIDDLELMQHVEVLGEIPPTWSASTPRGKHFYFNYDPRVKTTTALLGKGIDIRADGSYVVGPGSEVEGRRYTWDMHPTKFLDAEIADPPEWMCKQRRKDAYVNSDPLAITDSIHNGERNNTLASVAGYLHTKIHNYSMVSYLVHQLNDKFCDTPLDREEVDRIVSSTKRYH